MIVFCFVLSIYFNKIMINQILKLFDINGLYIDIFYSERAQRIHI
jgi:hypothetical protein